MRSKFNLILVLTYVRFLRPVNIVLTYSVEMLDCYDDLPNIYSHFVFGKFLSLVEVCEQFATVHIICKDEYSTT